jgi:hypothetical protein
VGKAKRAHRCLVPSAKPNVGTALTRLCSPYEGCSANRPFVPLRRDMTDKYQQLTERDRVRSEARARLRQTIAAIQREAAERGLTAAELERHLADES